MADPRIEQYARLLVDTCVGVQPGWQVLVMGSALSRPLNEEVSRQIARKGAYALPRISHGGANMFAEYAWVLEAPLELAASLPPLEVHVLQHVDALIAIDAPENTRDRSAYDTERAEAVQKASRPAVERLLRHELPWVGCQYPTPALAGDAGMSTSAFADFLFGACLLDWDAERTRMQRYAERFDAANEVRIVAPGTDLTLSLAGRRGEVDAGAGNMPGGEFFYSPVEDSAEGVIHFAEFPAPYLGRDVVGIRLRFEGGRVVDAAAEREEEFLIGVLDTDEGARRIGELGIGCNPRITRYMRNTLFDEKIDGTVHLALGNGLAWLGGTNVSTIHWDIVKDLRDGGRIELDGEVVQENGRWRIGSS
jgi:aminopeptidase